MSIRVLIAGTVVRPLPDRDDMDVTLIEPVFLDNHETNQLTYLYHTQNPRRTYNSMCAFNNVIDGYIGFYYDTNDVQQFDW